MSQSNLAVQGNLSQGYLSQLENDEVQNPSASVIFHLAQALHVDPRILMEAAGYADTARPEDGEYEVTVDPELMRFLASYPREQQSSLLRLLRGFERRPASARNGAPQRRGRVRAV